MSKDELATKVADKTGLTQAKAKEAIQAALEEMREALVGGRKVELRGFGVFRPVRRMERTGRNPAHPEAGPVVIPARNVVKFKVGSDMDKVLNPVVA